MVAERAGGRMGWAELGLGVALLGGSSVPLAEGLSADLPDLWALLFAPLKPRATALLAEKATELGVAELWPFLLQMPSDVPLSHTNTQRQSAQQRFATPLRFLEVDQYFSRN